LIGGWNIFCVSLDPRILILNPIGWQFILNFHWIYKDEEAIDWSKGFRSFHWTRGTSSRKVMEAYQGGRFFWGACAEEERRRMKCEEGVSSYVWRGVHGKGVCKNQAWKEVVCSKCL
jgi:hypothetical protein